MDAKHTPGPWAVTLEDDSAIYINTVNPKGRIATVPKGKLAQEDARLIAAAPELLAALLDAVAALESYVPESDSEYQICIRARAAIAKAKGGQQ